jgi:hypothetical protein
MSSSWRRFVQRPSPNLSPHHALKSSAVIRGERDQNVCGGTIPQPFLICAGAIVKTHIVHFGFLSPLGVSTCSWWQCGERLGEGNCQTPFIAILGKPYDLLKASGYNFRIVIDKAKE